MRIHRDRRSLAAGRSARRGFTLIELLVTVIIIGILAVLAIPSMSLTSFDRNTYNDAGAIMQLFRSARTRAIARGSAVVVQMVTTGNSSRGGFFVYEAVSGSAAPTTSAPQMPVATCKWPTTWPTATMTPIDSFIIDTNPSSTDVLAGVMAQPYAYTAGNTAGAQFSEGYVCYTPLGHSYVNVLPAISGVPKVPTAGTPEFSGLSSLSALEIRVTRTDGATIRSVLIPNNGMARLFSHAQ